MSEKIEIFPRQSSFVNGSPGFFDVVTLGETMLRLTPPGYKRVTQATTLDIEVGGSESNTAVGLASLGLRVTWISRLTDNPLGHLIDNTLKGYGVDTSKVIWTEEDRIGLYFLEEGRAPRGSSIVYDRAGSAFSRFKPSDLPPDLFRAGNAKLLHLTGITPALGPDPEKAASKAVEMAKEAGWKISFDLNYRSKLWSPYNAHRSCHILAAEAHLIIAPLDDVRLLYNLKKDLAPEEVLDQLSNEFPKAAIILTLGKEGAIGREPGGLILKQAAFQAEEVGRLGGGDAFSAGLLFGYLHQEARRDWLKLALRWGTAAAALKYSTPGDMPILDKNEVKALVELENKGILKLKR